MIPNLPLQFLNPATAAEGFSNPTPLSFNSFQPKEEVRLNLKESELLELNLVCLDDQNSYQLIPKDESSLDLDAYDNPIQKKGSTTTLEKVKKNLDPNPFSYQIIPMPFKIDTQIIEELGEILFQKAVPIYQAVEALIVYQEENPHLSHIQTLTIVNPHSKFNGLEIRLEFFDTHPKSISIELMTNSTMSQYLSSEMQNLEKILKNRFQTIEFPKIALSLTPLFSTGLSQQKSKNKVSQKKVAEGKIVFKAAQEKL